MLTVYAENFRGFEKICLPLENVLFLTGDNSSGKTSIMYLVDFILSTELSQSIYLRHEGVAPYDYFSPYFGYADVIIGYCQFDSDSPKYKFVTIRRTPQGGGEVVRFTVARDGYAFSLQKSGSGVRQRLSKVPSFDDIDSLVQVHKSNFGFKRNITDLDADLNINTEDAVIRAAIPFLQDSKTRDIILKVIVRIALPDSKFIAALRAEPALYYSLDRRYQRRGEHFAAMAHDIKTLLPDEKKSDADSILQEFGSNSGLYDDVNFIIDRKRKGRSPVYVDIHRNGEVLGLNQLGFGLSQVLPIMVELLFSRYFTEKSIICLQQPELHLHPKAQAAFGEVFAKIASDDERLIVETHSDFVIDRFRSVIAEREEEVKASIIYCERSTRGNVVHKIAIDKDGSLVSPPDSYRDFFMSELARTL